MPRQTFKKPFLTIQEQINLLKQRGLIIDDESETKRYLANISYYHLAIYEKAFQDTETNQFYPNTHFKDILNLYVFDKRLRLMLLDLLERIEMSLKNSLIYEISKKTNDIFWHTNKTNFILDTDEAHNFYDSILKKMTPDNKEVYIQHYYKKYDTPPYPPSWMFFESLSFGECIMLISLLSDGNQVALSKKYALPYKVHITWLRCLNFLRNICAHHARLWNRKFTFTISGRRTRYESQLLTTKNNTFFAYLFVLQVFISHINPDSQWVDHLETLINEHNIEVSKMGFPENWKRILKSVS